MKIIIKDKSIKLGQILKIMGLIQTGGQAKWFIQENKIIINGEKPLGRGSTIKIGSILEINDKKYEVVSN